MLILPLLALREGMPSLWAPHSAFAGSLAHVIAVVVLCEDNTADLFIQCPWSRGNCLKIGSAAVSIHVSSPAHVYTLLQMCVCARLPWYSHLFYSYTSFLIIAMHTLCLSGCCTLIPAA